MKEKFAEQVYEKFLATTCYVQGEYSEETILSLLLNIIYKDESGKY